MPEKIKQQPRAFETPCCQCGTFIHKRRDGYGWHPDHGYFCVPCWETFHLAGMKAFYKGQEVKVVSPYWSPPAYAVIFRQAGDGVLVLRDHQGEFYCGMNHIFPVGEEIDLVRAP